MATENQTWLEKFRDSIPPEIRTQIDDLGEYVGKFTETELRCLLERVRLGEVRAVYQQIYAKMSGTEVLDAWDQINAKWQALNEEQWKRLESARSIALGILEVLTKLALVGVFL
ncbi:MAG: hypothetical protein HZA50_04400 [Planctomycetes bacterium]|nr:hypothetical protein [Planctomycetota bacterium]